MPRKLANIPKPSMTPARFAIITGRWTNIRMSTSGSSTIFSIQTQTANITIEPRKTPMVTGENQPHWWPCEIDNRSRRSAAPRLSAPMTSTRPPLLCLVAGTSVMTATSASNANPVAIQKALR